MTWTAHNGVGKNFCIIAPGLPVRRRCCWIEPSEQPQKRAIVSFLTNALYLASMDQLGEEARFTAKKLLICNLSPIDRFTIFPAFGGVQHHDPTHGQSWLRLQATQPIRAFSTYAYGSGCAGHTARQ